MEDSSSAPPPSSSFVHGQIRQAGGVQQEQPFGVGECYFLFFAYGIDSSSMRAELVNPGTAVVGLAV